MILRAASTAKVMAFAIPGIVAAVAEMALAQPAKDPAAPEPVAVVSELVVHSSAEVAVPRVGPGAPQLSMEQIQTAQTAARRLVSEDGTAVRQCSPHSPIGFARPTTIRALLGQAFQAEREAAQQVQRLADDARSATAIAQQARIAAVKGQNTPAEVEAAELSRQKAINTFTRAQEDLARESAAIPYLQSLIRQLPPPYGEERQPAWEMNAVSRIWPQVELYKISWATDQKHNIVASLYSGLALINVQAHQGEDAKGRFLQVTGEISNARAGPVRMPPVKFTELDSFGFPLNTVTADAGRGAQLKSGETKPFAYEIRPAASRIQSVQAVFGPPAPPPRRPATAPIAPMTGGPAADCSGGIAMMAPPPPMSSKGLSLRSAGIGR